MSNDLKQLIQSFAAEYSDKEIQMCIYAETGLFCEVAAIASIRGVK